MSSFSNPQANSALRDIENMPLSDGIAAYLKREGLLYAPDACIDENKSKVGYKIPFSRHFYPFEPPLDLHTIDEELKVVTSRILQLAEGLAE